MFKISNSLKKSIAQVLCLAIAFTPVISYAATERTGRASNLVSQGKVEYVNEENAAQNIIIDSEDLVTLAGGIDALEGEVDTLEQNAKWGQVQAIQSLPDVAQKNSLTGITLDTVGSVTFDKINDAIKNSQKVNPNGDEKVYVNNTNGRAEAAGTSGATEVQITGATANNLSAGTAAWVDGQYIVGNGADNNSYYNLGIQSVQPIYTEEQSITSSHRPSDPTYHGGSYTFPETYNGKKFLCILLTSVTYDPGVSTTTKITVTNNGRSISFYTSHSNGTIKFKGIYI